VSKRTYLIAVVDGVFCLDGRVMYKRETLSVVTLPEWSEITGLYNTPDTVARDR